MAIEKDIQMKVRKGTDWELLYPNTKASLVSGLKMFSKVKVNTNSVQAGVANDTLELVPGNNVTIATDINNKIVISSIASEYIHPNNENVRHVSDLEKNKWNTKETVEGAQAKADEAFAKSTAYTDLKLSEISLEVPTRVSQLINDANYTTVEEVQTKIDSVNLEIDTVENLLMNCLFIER